MLKVQTVARSARQIHLTRKADRLPIAKQTGFTLVEVLIALVIIAISFAAAIRIVGLSADTAAILHDRSLAMWVAQNRMARYQLERTWPAIGTREGEDEMADRKWRWKEKVSAPDYKDFRQIELEIRDAESDHLLARLVGGVRNYQTQSPLPGQPSS